MKQSIFEIITEPYLSTIASDRQRLPWDYVEQKINSLSNYELLERISDAIEYKRMMEEE